MIQNLMEDLQIAYYLIVILIGFATLAIAGFWAFKTKEPDLQNFCMVYAAFTLVLIVSVLNKYLTLNVEGYTAQAWYIILGIYLAVSFAVIVTLIHFLVGVYQLSKRKIISIVSFSIGVIAVGLIYSPIGAVLDAQKKVIQLGIGFKISTVLYLLVFTFALSIGYGFLRRVWKTTQQNFVLGLLIFATFGYIESALNFPVSIRSTSAVFGQDRGFLFSSIPYALYGLFLIYYFLHVSPQTTLGLGSVSGSFISTYNITERELEIIQKVLEGKSNADIARQLVISLATVKTHLHNIYTKVGVDSRYDLLARVRSMS